MRLHGRFTGLQRALPHNSHCRVNTDTVAAHGLLPGVHESTPLRPLMHKPDAHRTLALRSPPQTHSAQARPAHSTPQRRHELLVDGAAPMVAWGIL